MYEAVRQRAPISSKAFGVMTMILVTAGAGYVMATGFGGVVVKMIDEVATIRTLPPVDKQRDEPQETNTFNTKVDAPTPPVPPMPKDVFEAPDEPGTPPVRPTAGDDTTGGGRPPPPAPVRKMPVLIAKDKPPYPPIAIRHEWVGVSELTACVDAKGRVTSISVARTSSHDVLDEAALKWVRTAKFSPGTLDGEAQAMCGARVIYDWRLDR